MVFVGCVWAKKLSYGFLGGLSSLMLDLRVLIDLRRSKGFSGVLDSLILIECKS